MAVGPGAELSGTLTVAGSRGWQVGLITESNRKTWKNLKLLTIS